MFGEIDVDQVLTEVAKNGAALVPGAISSIALQRLNREIQLLKLKRAAETIGSVKQSFERIAFIKTVPGKLPALNALRASMEYFLRHSKKFPQLKTWSAIDTVIQKYSPGDFLTAHKDLQRHPLVIAICTISGSCNIEILADRNGPATKRFQPQAGDLLLLRASGLNSPGKKINTDNRPYHRVSGNTSEKDLHRISITFRDNTEPDKPIPGFAYENISPEKEEIWI